MDRCAVVTDGDLLLGVVKAEALDGSRDGTAREVMQAGPTTFRPGLPADDLARHLEDRGVQRALLTTSDGRLVGLFDRQDGLDPPAP